MKRNILSIFLFLLAVSHTRIHSQEKKEPQIPLSPARPEEYAASKNPEPSAWYKKILSRSSLSLLYGENGGQHIFESGIKYPNLSGIKAGSRITYNREFQYMGFEAKHWWDSWEFGLGYRTTGRYVRTGEGRDEDFSLYNLSKEQGTKIDFANWSFRDSPYTFTGSQNFADGRGKLKMKEDKISLSVRKYLGSSGPDSRKPGSGMFLSAGAHYSFFKYYLYDVDQWIATSPVTYGNIGIGLSYSNSTWEFPLGVGYRYSDGKWILEGAFLGNVWYSHIRDYHYHRNLNFIGDSSGYGVETHLGTGYILESWLFFLKLTENRLYGSGTFTTKGGIDFEDIKSNYSGSFRNYLSTKQFSVELQATSFLDWVSR